jgi:hypothetical protein
MQLLNPSIVKALVTVRTVLDRMTAGLFVSAPLRF